MIKTTGMTYFYWIDVLKPEGPGAFVSVQWGSIIDAVLLTESDCRRHLWEPPEDLAPAVSSLSQPYDIVLEHSRLYLLYKDHSTVARPYKNPIR